MRVSASYYNLVDGYPAFGIDVKDDNIELDVKYPEKLSNGMVLVKALFGGLMVFPHIFILLFQIIGVLFVNIIAWFAVLFTGKYPKNMHAFVVRVFKFSTRISVYLNYMTDEYPPLSVEK